MNASKIIIFIIGLIVGGLIVNNNVSSSYESKLRELSESYNDIFEKYTITSDEYRVLESDYLRIKGYLLGLSEDVKEFSEALDTRFSIPEAFPHLLNEDAVSTVGLKVREITADTSNRWTGYQEIYRYVADEVEYVYDIEFPYIFRHRYVTIDDNEVYTEFNFRFKRNYLQNPDFTLEFEQGDCDDQAILLYAMIQYYREEVLDVRYSLYLMLVYFDNSSHLAVLLPSTDERICILDPAGHYLTESNDVITANHVHDELQKYEGHWDKYTGIEKITLYHVFKDGSYEVSIEGSLEDVSNFFNT